MVAMGVGEIWLVMMGVYMETRAGGPGGETSGV